MLPVDASRFLPEGLMNRNWRLDTADGSFALKMIADAAPDVVRRNLAVLGPLAGTGLPVPVPVPGPGGDPVVEIGDRAFCLFPWVEGARIPGTDLTMDQTGYLGSLLGQLHRHLESQLAQALPTTPGKALDPRPSLSAPPEPKTAVQALAEADRLLAVIAAKDEPDAFDASAVAMLRARRALIAEYRESRPDSAGSSADSGWIHGDFTSSNLLWNAGAVEAVLDWDRLQRKPLSDEVVRAAILHFKAADGQVDLGRVAAFVEGYREAVPMDGASLAEAVRRLWWHQITSFWILWLHYERDDPTCDHLLVPRENLLRWWTDHYDEVESAFTRSGS
ncbi:MAG TPA: phosphotransferase [Glycomyces sp.]|nr:phosphotransferase [Glycomyces sp.]